MVVSVVGIHPGAPVEAVGAGLLTELRTHLRVDTLASPTPEELQRAEGSLDRVLLVAGSDDPSRDFCLRQADHVVLVAAADAAVPDAESLDQQGADLVLVGVRPEEEMVRRWCHALEPWQVTIVAEGAPREDLRMLAARIGGWSVGMVLAGGGARAFAHIGVLQELAAAGIVVDRVAGSSVGAIVAGAYASGMDPETMHEVFYSEFVRRNPIGTTPLPTVSLIKGRRTRHLLRNHLGGREIQALARQFRCMSVDLLGRVPVEHRRGDLAEAVSASVSIPVVFPPMRLENRLLVDGGVLDNLPVRLLTERDEGPILAVNIAMGSGGGGSARTGPPRMPSMGDTLLRVMMIGSGGAVAGRPRPRSHGDHATPAGGRHSSSGTSSTSWSRRGGWLPASCSSRPGVGSRDRGDPPRTHQSPFILAAFRPWGGSQGDATRGVGEHSTPTARVRRPLSGRAQPGDSRTRAAQAGPSADSEEPAAHRRILGGGFA